MFEDLELKIEEAADIKVQPELGITTTNIHTNAHTCTTNTCSMGKLCC